MPTRRGRTDASFNMRNRPAGLEHQPRRALQQLLGVLPRSLCSPADEPAAQSSVKPSLAQRVKRRLLAVGFWIGRLLDRERVVLTRRR